MFKDKTYQKMIQDYDYILEEKIYPEMLELQKVYDDKRNEIRKGIRNERIKVCTQIILRIVLLVSMYICFFSVNKYLGITIFIVYVLISRKLSECFKLLSNIAFCVLLIAILFYSLVLLVLGLFESVLETISFLCFILFTLGISCEFILELLLNDCSLGEELDSYKCKLKNIIIPFILESLGNIIYARNTNKKIINNELFKEHNLMVLCLRGADAFYGNRNGVDFGILEASENTLVISFQLNKSVKEQVLVTSKNSETLLEKMTRKKIALEDVDFNKEYSVYCHDEVYARYALTPSFIKRFKNLRLNFNAYNIVCSMKDDKIIFIMNKNEDLFEIKYSNTERVDRGSVTEVFFQLASIMLMIDYFKLDEKTGL